GVGVPLPGLRGLPEHVGDAEAGEERYHGGGGAVDAPHAPGEAVTRTAPYLVVAGVDGEAAGVLDDGDGELLGTGRDGLQRAEEVGTVERHPAAVRALPRVEEAEAEG